MTRSAAGGVAPEPATRARIWIAAAIAGAIVIAAVAAARIGQAPAQAPPVIADLGGDFELSGAGRARVRLQDYRGRIVLLFFGYTHCPDVCPTGLYTLKQAVEGLGKSGDQAQVIMVSVDPQRDSPDHLAQYMRYFDPRFVGLSGTPEEVDKVARQYRVFYRRGDSTRQGEYLVSHSAYVYALDRQGRVRALHGAEVKPAEITETVRQLLREPGGARKEQ